MPHLTLAERVAVNENRFITIDKKMDEVCFKLDRVYDALPEIVRKVNSHHMVFHDHVEQLRDLAKSPPVVPRPTNGEGNPLERRTKKPWREQFVELALPKKVTVIVVVLTFLFAYGDWFLERSVLLLNWLEKVL